ncbi:DUF2490 domain-containing protein [Salinivirga cyanobacteriivorans]
MKHGILLLMLFIFHGFYVHGQELRGELGVGSDIAKFKGDAELQIRRLSIENNSYSLLGQLKIEYEAADWLDVGITYRYKATGESDSYADNHIDYNNKNRYTFDLQYKSDRFDNDIKLKNRLRYQVNVDADGDKVTYFRNRLTLDYKLTNLYRPYMAAEVYYKTDEQIIKNLRLYLGSEFEMERHSIELFYILEADIEKKPEMVYILGLAYGIKL